jgi:hypothetical protein
MAALRRLASRWLRAVVRIMERHAPPACREWASAMLRELDFIESDWAALRWALGSTAAICRHSLREWRAWFKGRGREEETTMKDTAMKVVGVLFGVLIAVAVMGAGAFAVHGVLFHFFPALDHRGVPWPVWTLALILEALLVVGTVKLWKKRRPMAIGILLATIIFGTHFVIHIASRWNG